MPSFHSVARQQHLKQERKEKTAHSVKFTSGREVQTWVLTPLIKNQTISTLLEIKKVLTLVFAPSENNKWSFVPKTRKCNTMYYIYPVF